MMKVFILSLFCLLAILINPNDASFPSTQNNKTKRFKVLISHPEVSHVATWLLEHECKLIQVQSLPPSRSELLEKVRGVDGILWSGHSPLDAEILNAAGPQLKSVSIMSDDVDLVDLAELKRRNISLGHGAKFQTSAVADLAVGLLIAAGRRFHEGRKKIDSDKWENYHLNWMLGQQVSGSTVGFFGFGYLDQAIAKRLSGFDIEQILYTTRGDVNIDIDIEKLHVKKVKFDELLAWSDYIVIASPLRAETQGIFNATAFNKMKKTAVLVNIARGKIVNQDDLYDALKTNKIFAAGLDVSDPEPLKPNDKLLTLDNLVITPHIGSATAEARSAMAVAAAYNILAGMSGERMRSPVYLENLKLNTPF